MGLGVVADGVATVNRDPTGAIFVTYVVTPASPSVYCQGNLTSRLSEEGSSTPEPTSHAGGSSLVLTVLATSTDHGCDVVIEDVRVAMAANDRDPRGNPGGSTNNDSALEDNSSSILKNSTDSALEDSDAVTIAPVEVAARSDAMDRRLDVGSAAGVGNVGVADGRGLWAAKSASAGAAGS